MVAFIEADVMASDKVRRRNVLHEPTNPGRGDLYFVFNGDHHLNLRLLRPMHDVAELEEEPLAVLFEECCRAGLQAAMRSLVQRASSMPICTQC